MTNEEIHELIDYVISKEQGAWVSPEEKDTLLHSGQLLVFADYARVYGTSQESQEALAPFKGELPFATDADGVYTLTAADSEQITGVLILVAGRTRPLKFVGEDELAYRLDSQLRKPSATNPVGLIAGKGKIKVYPEAVHAGRVHYLRTPKAPVTPYNLVGRAIAFTAGGQPLEWGVKYQHKVILKTLQLLGLPLESDRLVSYADAFYKGGA